MPIVDEHEPNFVPVYVRGSSDYTATVTEKGYLYETGNLSGNNVADQFKFQKAFLKQKVTKL